MKQLLTTEVKESGEKPLRQFSPVHQGQSKDESQELSVRPPPPGAGAIADSVTTATRAVLLNKPPMSAPQVRQELH